MCSRGTYQLRKLSLFFCDWGGSSQGIRSLLASNDLQSFQQQHPHIDFEVILKRNHHPYFLARWINGYIRDVPIRSYSKEEILEQFEHCNNTCTNFHNRSWQEFRLGHWQACDWSERVNSRQVVSEHVGNLPTSGDGECSYYSGTQNSTDREAALTAKEEDSWLWIPGSTYSQSQEKSLPWPMTAVYMCKQRKSVWSLAGECLGGGCALFGLWPQRVLLCKVLQRHLCERLTVERPGAGICHPD